MKQLHKTNNGMIEISHDELKSVTGGGVGTAILGFTIFGMARLLGVMVGYSNL
jgi:bacteriocin-like protein